jgi:hypothetical protein
MQIYSNTINTFITKAKNWTKDILANEMKLQVRRNRFEFNGYLIPIHIIVFEHPSQLGRFEPHTYQVGLNKNLMLFAKDSVIKDILRHELAHLICFLKHGAVAAHGEEFKAICNQYGFSKDISKASAELESLNENKEGDLISEKLLNRVKKLMALGSSSNPHEAQMATAKANELLLKHNLNSLSESHHDEEEVCLKRVLSAKRSNAKMHAVYEILHCFFVQPVFSHGKGQVFLEVIGSRVNVELADYVANYLDQELESLYKNAQKENPKLKGAAKKNAFLKGVSQGYVQKINEYQHSTHSTKEIISLKGVLKEQVNLVYNRLSYSKSGGGKTCQESKKLGTKAGKNLNIRSALNNKTTGKKLSLPFFKK